MYVADGVKVCVGVSDEVIVGLNVGVAGGMRDDVNVPFGGGVSVEVSVLSFVGVLGVLDGLGVPVLTVVIVTVCVGEGKGISVTSIVPGWDVDVAVADPCKSGRNLVGVRVGV